MNRIEKFQTGIAECERHKRELIPSWKESVDYRRGKPFKDTSDRDRVAVNVDAPYTRAHIAALWAQTPEVRLNPSQDAFKAAIPPFQRKLNEVIREAGTDDARFEVMPDVVNAAGFGAVLVSYDVIQEEQDVPDIEVLEKLPAPLQFALVQSGKVPLKKAMIALDEIFRVESIEPEDFLWPRPFKGSNFDDSPWVGRRGTCTWSDGKRRFGLKDEDKSKVLGTEQVSEGDESGDEDEKQQDVVTFKELFYKWNLFHDDARSFDQIGHIVFVEGLDKPVVDETWNGQQFVEESGDYVGACKYPIRVLVIDHISGEAIPPSFSALGRPQVNELIRSRSQMIEQREHSKPLRTFNPAMVDAQHWGALRRGTWQGFLSVKGDPNRAIGEVARASYPRENYDFDRVAKGDLDVVHGMGANQMGNFASGERSASEARIVQGNHASLIGMDRGRVEKFFIGIVEVLAGLFALYGDFDIPEVSPEEQQRMQAWDRRRISQQCVFSVLTDSMIVPDANQRIEQLLGIMEKTVNVGGFVNPEPIQAKVMNLAGLDPAEVMVKPGPKPPDEPKIAFNFSGEDLANPMVQQILMKSGLLPPPPPPMPPGGPSGPGGLPPLQNPELPMVALPGAGLTARTNRRRTE